MTYIVRHGVTKRQCGSEWKTRTGAEDGAVILSCNERATFEVVSCDGVEIAYAYRGELTRLDTERGT